MAWYEIYRNDEPFEKYYSVKPHLSKIHERYFEKNCLDEYLEFANRYHPQDYNEWKSSLGKLFKYEEDLYAKVDKENNLIIISYYSLDYDELFMRFIYDIETTAMYHYKAMSFKLFAYVLNKCTNDYKMGGYTDMDKFYSQRQRKLDDKSIEILKTLDQFKYLPIEKFKRFNVYNLFQVNEDMIYQYEILLKNNLSKLATDLLMGRRFITPDNFKRYKKQIMNGIRYEELNRMIYAHKREEEERERKLKKQEKINLFTKMPKLEFDLGDYVLMHPKTFKELEHEGRELHHCVASYLDRIVSKETDVMFLRKKDEPDTPYFTIELRNNSVTQVRTLKNQTDQFITNLIEQWNSQRTRLKA